MPLHQDIHQAIAKNGGLEDAAVEEHVRHRRRVSVRAMQAEEMCQVPGHGDVRLVGQPELAEARRPTPFGSVVHCAHREEAVEQQRLHRLTLQIDARCAANEPSTAAQHRNGIGLGAFQRQQGFLGGATGMPQRH